MPDVDGDVEHASPHHAHELRLCVAPPLEVEPADDAAARQRLVVLHEAHGAHPGVELPLRITLEIVAARIAEHLRCEQLDSLYFGLQLPHRVVSSSILSRYCPYWFLRIGSAISRSRSAEIHPSR